MTDQKFKQVVIEKAENGYVITAVSESNDSGIFGVRTSSDEKMFYIAATENEVSKILSGNLLSNMVTLNHKDEKEEDSEDDSEE